MADRLDLIPGLIQSLSRLGPLQLVTAQPRYPLCILLVAKFTHGTVPKEVDYWTVEGPCDEKVLRGFYWFIVHF